MDSRFFYFKINVDKSIFWYILILMKIHIEINDEKHGILKEVRTKTGQSFNWSVNKALDNYFVSKHLKPAGSNEKQSTKN